MRSGLFRLSIVVVLLGLLLPSISLAAQGDKKPSKFTLSQLEHFEKKIRPLLVKRCYKCHSAKSKKLQGGLRLDSRALAIEGGDSGPAIDPDEPDASLLIEGILFDGELKMPPKSKLPAEEIKLLVDWVKAGAPWPNEAAEPGSTKTKKKPFDLKQRMADHWIWQPAKVVAPPAAPEKFKEWAASPIDAFILAKMLKGGLTPSKPADRRTLIRRVYFDLIGLPPSLAQIETFAGDKSPQAYKTLVDGLLASEHFGERWGRHWLDLVRYAESRGHEFDHNTPNAWQYRDYVIRALNADVPYNQFVVEHIAGDLIEQPRMHPQENFNESIIGTGFWYLGEWIHSPVDIRNDETDRQDNQIDVFGKTFLGLTLACARCHDHKFDAISQADYYAMAGYLQSSGYRLARIDSLVHNRQIAEQLDALRRKSTGRIARATIDAQRPVLGRLSEYLMAAREVIQAKPLAAVAGRKDPPANETLDPKVLAAWVKHLRAVSNNADDPLHPWAKIAADNNAKTAEQLAGLLRGVVDTWSAKAAASKTALKDAQVIIDYTSAHPGQWISDGVSFGLGPERLGDVRLGGDAANPISGVATFGAARRDPAFANLKLSGGAANDVGNIGRWVRSGQTIRTPTFTVEHGTIYYLVQGAGHAFAEVDSHRLIAGPLHGRVITQWNDDTKGKPRWVAHNLSDYKGHRVHVELTPKSGGNMAVLMVVQAARTPGVPTDCGPAPLLAEALSKTEAKSPQAVADVIAGSIALAAKALADGKLVGSTDAAKIAPLADWIVRHPDLFSPAGGAAREKIAKAASSYMDEKKKLEAQIKRDSRLAIAMWDGSAEDERLLIRGSAGTPGPRTPRRMPTALGGQRPSAKVTGSGRLELARHLVDPANPLISRVMVNRLWHHLFGRGIVASVDNFGVLGEAPSHPELLNHLADQFVKDGWSVKKAIRRMVLSSTYRMSSKPNAKGSEIDPGNLLLHRMRIRRLEGEVIRDAILAISGRLDRKVYGQSVPVYLTAFMTGRGRPGGGPLDGNGRRSIYTSVRRNFLSPMMLAFDMPQPFSSMGRRTVSNVPAQALIMMNDPLVFQQAQRWAKGVLAEKDMTAQQRIEKMYLTAFARGPSEAETNDALAFLQSQAKLHGIPAEKRDNAEQPWADLCHVLFNVKQFIFVN